MLQGDFIGFTRGLFTLPIKESKEPGQPPRRADSLSIEAKLSKRSGSKPTKKGTRSKGHHKLKSSVKRTPFSDEYTKQPFATSPYPQDQHPQGYDQSYLSESDDESESENLGPSMYGPPATHLYTQPAPVITNNGSFNITPGTIAYDPTGMKRNPPPLVNLLPRTYASPGNSHNNQSLDR
jgi:hypothetical protein